MEAMNEQDEMLVMSGKEHREVLKRMLSYTKYHIPSLIWTGVLVLLVTLADVFAPILIKIFLDDYLTPMNLEMQALLILGAGYLGLTIGKSVVWYFQLLFFQKIALEIVQQMRIDIFTKLHSLGMRYFDKTPAGSIVSRVTNDTEAVKDMFINVLSTAIQSLFMLVGIYAAMFALNV
ncbi:TPA_asm: ABC transporter ATP-binding protein, partial [Listeria monocytogenes]|nr:ABC transporter ATP-binding protein [Listeria monocytogenes]HAC1991540.1 ABC transporter ATP-binding protein [Listeria monocytogenes]